MTKTLLALLVIVSTGLTAVAGAPDFVVSPGGRFRTIQEAIDSVPAGASRTWVVYIRNGIYNEKVFIRKSNIALVGENWDSTRIVFASLREEWNRLHNGSDWGAGVVNIDTGTSNVTLANLTVYNNHGFLYGTSKQHQFAIRGAGTRIMLLHCKVISDGGDALSLWNRNDGMYYHADCYFEGWVDYVCPRGWCYITGSRFFGHNTPSASLWHDGSGAKDQKFVITNSTFDGVPGFPLGRNHLDGQFYLLNCRFSKNMADRPFYRPPSSPREWQWGDRHYYYNCHRDNGDFDWFKDNLASAEGSPEPAAITARWTFGGLWDPEASIPSLLPFASFPTPTSGALDLPAPLELTWVPGLEASSHRVFFGTAEPLELKATTVEARFDPGHLQPNATYLWRIDEVTASGVILGDLWRFTTR